MTVAECFSEFLDNLAIDNKTDISQKYGEITRSLNKAFRNTDSKKENSLQVGSFGRKTGIKGISDLDMLYLMPAGKWEDYKDGGQRRLLRDAKDAILARYPNTDVRVDRLVVTVTYSSFKLEVQPVFEMADGSFKYPDTKSGGSWKLTKPKEEMSAVSRVDTEKNGNLRRLCKMGRAWKNKHGIVMSGLLIDTLAYNFLTATDEYDASGVAKCDQLACDFFEYLSMLPKQDRFAAPGSRQHVKVKKNFQRKAQKTHRLSLEAIEAETNQNVNEKWKKVFGRPFPAAKTKVAMESASPTWEDTEQFIEDFYRVDIRFNLNIDCDVKQNGFLQHRLREMLERKIPLLPKKKLLFKIVENEVPDPDAIMWKVLNRGPEARKRNETRGQIIRDEGKHSKSEDTQFKGNHVVECYAIKDNVVVARDMIDVPITTKG